MAETKVKALHQGQTVDAVDVPVAKADERTSEYRLEDGSMLRIKFAVGSVLRLIDRFDAEGNPVYVVKGTAVIFPVVSESLRKKG